MDYFLRYILLGDLTNLNMHAKPQCCAGFPALPDPMGMVGTVCNRPHLAPSVEDVRFVTAPTARHVFPPKLVEPVFLEWVPLRLCVFAAWREIKCVVQREPFH
jgi:hypothetical protein